MKYEDIVESAFRNPLLVAGALIAGSLVMWLADAYSSRERRLASMTLGHALFVGFAQAIALVPGRLPLGHHHLGRPCRRIPA